MCIRDSWYWQRLYFHPQNPLPDQTHFPIFVFLKESVSDSEEKMCIRDRNRCPCTALSMHFLDVIGLNCLFRTGFLEIMRNKEWCHNPTENRPGARRLQEHCKKSYQIMISHIPTNMILTNYLRGPGIIPDPQTRPSSFSLKPAPQTKPSKTGILKGPAPHDWPSISSANPQKLWLSFLCHSNSQIWN